MQYTITLRVQISRSRSEREICTLREKYLEEKGYQRAGKNVSCQVNYWVAVAGKPGEAEFSSDQRTLITQPLLRRHIK